MDEMENFDNLENNFFFFTSNKSEYEDYCLVKNLEQSEFETQN